MIAFQVGKTYTGRSAAHSLTVFHLRVQSRTAKTITDDRGRRYKVRLEGDVEAVSESYSMAPVFRANQIAWGGLNHE